MRIQLRNLLYLTATLALFSIGVLFARGAQDHQNIIDIYRINSVSLRTARSDLLETWRVSEGIDPGAATVALEKGSVQIVVTFRDNVVVVVEGEQLDVGSRLVRKGLDATAVHSVLGLPDQLMHTGETTERAPSEVYYVKNAMGRTIVVIGVRYRDGQVDNVSLTYQGTTVR